MTMPSALVRQIGAAISIQTEGGYAIAIVYLGAGNGLGQFFKRLGTPVALVNGLGLLAPEISLCADRRRSDPTIARG